ncbi:aldo/keto reductase family protein [Novosphingobium flavum]|uniref:Aldo/keto reductase family protein n=1 Tax=Novosphingobium flavum TaxID=1778672 RepID=A0A7X1FTH1_9SPHN|nr:aldo/keto reductase family protein [Novosphingobium flavum]MBC2666680.1 aldo/keto reductase family protein [Novosphingobium flavum]
MEHRFIGRSGLMVSALTFGNWLTQGAERDRQVAERCIGAALDLGITSFDTADTYANGAAEECLGAALKGQRRSSLVVMSKCFYPAVPAPRGPNEVGLSRKHIMESINGSLSRLGMDYVDVYMAHRYDRFTPLEETMQAFADIVRQGKALYIGVSEWMPEALREGQALARQMGFSLISNQSQYSMLWRVIEGEVVPTSQELGISQMVWSPMAQGVLSGKYLPGQAAPEGSRALDTVGGGAQMISRWLTDEVLQAVQNLKPVAADLGVSMSQMALAWVLKNPNVATAVIGASRPEQLTENVKAAEIDLSPDVMARIDAILAGVANTDPALTAQFTPAARPGG